MSRILILCLTGISLVLYACCKETEQPENLPEISTSGEDMFACRINGEIFVRSDCGPYVTDLSPYYFVDGGNYLMTVTNEHHFDEPIDLSFNIEGYYGALEVIELSTEYHKRPIQGWYLDTLKPHFIEFLRFDTLNRIASGTFEFTCINSQDSLDIREVTEGRFDLATMRMRY